VLASFGLHDKNSSAANPSRLEVLQRWPMSLNSGIIVAIIKDLITGARGSIIVASRKTAQNIIVVFHIGLAPLLVNTTVEILSNSAT
jgi:hypothetical protein